jgi:pyridinium-3,5-bisthiocarboxylic acid mononucleotide nickel chelatase
MHIHLDLLGGLAGDMFLAGAIDAGLVDVPALEQALRTLGLGQGIRIVTERVLRGAIEGTHVHFEGWDPAADADHRHLSTILKMLDDSGLTPSVRERAKLLFDALGRAEAAIHGISLERVHFHEVGAVDSLLDFVSAAYIIDSLDATWSFGAVPCGTGTIETDHGTIPVPAPATARLLEGLRVKQTDIEAELVTPTGAAILRGLGPVTEGTTGYLARTGYGCGTRNMKRLSNVVRFAVFDDGRKVHSMTESDRVIRLTCEIDDMNPELLASVEERLFTLGALDVVREPVLMKKGRLATRLSVLSEIHDQERLIECILRETTTFGLRTETLERVKLRRSFATVETPYGAVDVKVGYWGSQPIKAVPEFAACQKVASSAGVPVQSVYDAAVHAARALLLDDEEP